MSPEIKSTMQGRAGARAFSLLEITVVIVVMGVLSAMVVPALRTMDEARAGAAAEEIERRLVMARTNAIAMGRPVGLRIDPVAATLQQWDIKSSGAAPTVAMTGMGQADEVFNVAARYPGVRVTSLVGGNNTSGVQTIWFAYDGTPHLRTSGGTHAGVWTSDAVVTVTGGLTVRVRRGTGAVQR